jgi:putative oxidoreductase
MRNDAGTMLARWLIASVFVVMGAWRLLAASHGAEIANGTLVFSGVELLLGLLIAFGWRLRWTASLGALLLLADAVMSHPFWSLPEPDRSTQLLHFMKNVAIVGGLLLLAAGAGRDRRHHH